MSLDMENLNVLGLEHSDRVSVNSFIELNRKHLVAARKLYNEDKNEEAKKEIIEFFAACDLMPVLKEWGAMMAEHENLRSSVRGGWNERIALFDALFQCFFELVPGDLLWLSMKDWDFLKANEILDQILS